MSDRDDTGDRDPRRRREELSDDDRAPNRRGDEGNGGGIGPRRNDDFLEFRTFVEERFNQIISANKKTQRQLRDQETIRTKPFKHAGNERQYSFNTTVMQHLEDAKDSLHDNSLRDSARSINKAIDLLHNRNKMIRLADRSQAGWATVKEYEDDDLADDSADEHRLRGVDSRATAAMKRNPDNVRYHPYSSAHYSRGRDRFRNVCM